MSRKANQPQVPQTEVLLCNLIISTTLQRGGQAPNAGAFGLAATLNPRRAEELQADRRWMLRAPHRVSLESGILDSHGTPDWQNPQPYPSNPK